ncbi:surfeit locus protein 6 [Ochotona princeps]|uniref:surfeit locus protein 6 n=1 Tax=Ochotona princeps TaxID=9978 RepID=UPI002714AA27|nr:surfeit locus protein 6 [Ochotona princeps]
MASLLAKDAYLQGLAKKICAQPGPEPRERKWAGKPQGSEAARPPKKRRKKSAKKSREPQGKAPGKRAPEAGVREPAAAVGPATPSDSVFALDVLRERLHEKIREARGQGAAADLSPAALEKRRRRQQERARRKRKREELRVREKAAKAGEAEAAATPTPEAPCKQPPEPAGLIFNKVEVSEEEPVSRAQRRREKQQRVKGNLTPLTGRNYRQLLERLRARQDRLETLREQDAGKAQELQAKMQWTNLLYKAEGVRIRDDEGRLQEALKRKEQRRAQRQRRWEKRAAHVVEKMQQRQDKRRQNLRRKKAARAERRLHKARKKGRILPQDLERAGLA